MSVCTSRNNNWNRTWNNGLVPLRWGCALPSPNAPGKAPNHIHTTLRWGRAPGIFDDPADVGNLISGSSAFSKSSLNFWEFTVHILLKPGLENFKHYFTSMWDECNCAVVWAFFGIALLWDWNENWPFPVLWPLLSFPNLLAYWVQHHLLGLKELNWNSITSTSFVSSDAS